MYILKKRIQLLNNLRFQFLGVDVPYFIIPILSNEIVKIMKKLEHLRSSFIPICFVNL